MEPANLPPLVTPNFVTFPVVNDPNFGDTNILEVDSNPIWKEAAISVVGDPEDTRQKRLGELRDELKGHGIKLCPGDDNQLLSFLRAGQGNVARALHVVNVFLCYQQYEKNGMSIEEYVLTSITLCKHTFFIEPRHGRTLIQLFKVCQNMSNPCSGILSRTLSSCHTGTSMVAASLCSKYSHFLNAQDS